MFPQSRPGDSFLLHFQVPSNLSSRILTAPETAATSICDISHTADHPWSELEGTAICLVILNPQEPYSCFSLGNYFFQACSSRWTAPFSLNSWEGKMAPRLSIQDAKPVPQLGCSGGTEAFWRWSGVKPESMEVALGNNNPNQDFLDLLALGSALRISHLCGFHKSRFQMRRWGLLSRVVLALAVPGEVWEAHPQVLAEVLEAYQRLLNSVAVRWCLSLFCHWTTL